MIDPIDLLARDDKWFLGSGDGSVFAPSAPEWLDVPGFWDAASILDATFAPLFTVAVLGDDGRELPMRLQSRRWTPAELTLEYRLPHGVTASEVRTVHPGGIFVSEWRLRAMREMPLHLVAWTAQDASTIVAGSARWQGALAFGRRIPAASATLPVVAELACLGGATSWGALHGEGSIRHPQWQLTPFAERWEGEGLPGAIRLPAGLDGGTVFFAVHRVAHATGEGTAWTFAMRIAPAGPAARAAPARPALAAHSGTLGGASRRRWQELFGRAPSFRCSDPYLETYYWYRWYGLWLNAVGPGTGRFTEASLCDGIGALRHPTAVGAPCHVRELRWLSDPTPARGALRSFLARQRDDGALPHWIGVAESGGDGAVLGDWGSALLALDAAAPDDALLREVVPRLARHADWLIAARDPHRTGMFEGGAAPAAGAAPRKTVEATVYAYMLFRALARLAERAGAGTADHWRHHAERTVIAVRGTMWDSEAGLFYDVDATGAHVGIPGATAFYPYYTDLATAQHLAGLEQNLLEPDRFWTPFPVPSAALDDPRFSALGEEGGTRRALPRNGRVWPHTNSHLVEALGRAAISYAPHLRPAAARLLHRTVRMMFHDGDLRRPNCHEHYNPITGQASVHRGLDDVQRSWVNDLIIQYVLGVRPHASGITVDPFPFGVDFAEITGVSVRGIVLDVRIEGERISATVNGATREGRLGTAMEVGQ